MNIADLKQGMNNINIIAKIIELSEPKEIATRFGSQTTLTTAVLEDDSGTVKLTLWGNQSEGLEEGKTVEINGGFTKEFRDELQVGIGRTGKIKVVE